MGIGIGIEIEGEDDLYQKGIDTLNSDLFAHIIMDISEGNDTVTNMLADKYGFSLENLGKVGSDENSEIGPWQDPIDAWEEAYALFDAFAKEGTELLGKEISYYPVDVEMIPAYMKTLSEAITILKYAHEKKKNIRLCFC